MDLDLIPYGSPDEKLIGSDEFGPLVKICYWISQFLNYLVSLEIGCSLVKSVFGLKFFSSLVGRPN